LNWCMPLLNKDMRKPSTSSETHTSSARVMNSTMQVLYVGMSEPLARDIGLLLSVLQPPTPTQSLVLRAISQRPNSGARCERNDHTHYPTVPNLDITPPIA